MFKNTAPGDVYCLDIKPLGMLEIHPRECFKIQPHGMFKNTVPENVLKCSPMECLKIQSQRMLKNTVVKTEC